MPLIPSPSADVRHRCRTPSGLLTRHIPVPGPSGAAHANRLSCRFVSPKAPVLGAACGGEPTRDLQDLSLQKCSLASFSLISDNADSVFQRASDYAGLIGPPCLPDWAIAMH